MVKAVSVELKNVRKHPGADRLQIADATGYSVIVGMGVREGEKGFLIPEGAQLSRDFCLERGLYRKHPDTGERLGGYLDANGRVVAMSLRGEKSEGLFLPWGEVPARPVGEEFDEIGGSVFVRKYVSPFSRRGERGKSVEIGGFPRHYDTAQLRLSTHDLAAQTREPGAILIVTEKLHGTSGRTGKVLLERPLGALGRLWNRLVPRAWALKGKKVWSVVTGTRRTIVGDSHRDAYRLQWGAFFGERLRAGEVVYYEIVGPGIMPSHDLGKLKGVLPGRQFQELRRKFGERIVYAYGCEEGETRAFVYRITQDGRELRWWEVEARCKDMGVATVPVLAEFEGSLDADAILYIANSRSRVVGESGSTLDRLQPGEGVCLRVDSPEKGAGAAVKHKGFVFCVCEGIAANDPEFVDPEDEA